MGAIKNALIAEADRNSVANAVAASEAHDPYDVDRLIIAARKVIAWYECPPNIPGGAFQELRQALAAFACPEPVPPGGGRFASEREYQEHVEASTYSAEQFRRVPRP